MFSMNTPGPRPRGSNCLLSILFRSCELEYYGFEEGVQGEEHGQVVATGEHADKDAV